MSVAPNRNPCREETPDLGRSLKSLRRQRGFSLAQLSQRSSIPQSTLSKVENGEMSLNFDKLHRLALALETGVETLFSPAGQEREGPNGRRVIDPAGAPDRSTEHYRYRHLCADLSSRLMFPMYLEVGDRTKTADPGVLPTSDLLGERFVYVLEGPVEFHCLHYRMRVLQTGDSLYVDAVMPHAFVAPDGGVARLISVITSHDDAYLEAARDGSLAGEADISGRVRRRRHTD